MRHFIALGIGAFTAMTCGRAAAQQLAPRSRPAVLHPGDPALRALARRDTTYRLRMLLQPAAGDTGGRTLAVIWYSERPADTASVEFTNTIETGHRWADSLLARRRGLAPVREHLENGRKSLTFAYQGRRVVGFTVVQGSAPQAFDTTFAQVPFARTEDELLVRTLPLDPGFQAVVPMFSETDEALELDTITVLPSDSTSPDLRRVRLADPAIVETYTVAASSGEILAREVVQRRSGTRLRLVNPDSP